MAGRVNLLNWDGVGTLKAVPEAPRAVLVSTADRLLQRRIVHRAASSMLCYPEADPAIAAALQAPSGQRPRASLTRLLLYLSDTAIDDLQKRYVDVFDLTSKRCLYLSYYTDGDTRRREPFSLNSRRDTAPAASLSTLVESCPTTSPWCSNTPRSPIRPMARACCRNIDRRSSCYALPCSTSTRRTLQLEAVAPHCPVRRPPTPPRS